MATLQNLGVLKYRDKDGNWKPLPVVLQSSGGGGSGGISTISGKGKPTESTVGRLNQLYRDEDTQRLYICTAVDGGYTWAAVSGGSVDVDATLTKAGQAADAKAAGEAIKKKLDATALPTAVNDALAQAKASGEFDGAKGDKGDTGPEGPKGDTGPVGPKGADGKDGAGMDVTGAKVGQIARITAVDSAGKPTAWGPVDMPSEGSGETWEKIADIALSAEIASYNVANFATWKKIKIIMERDTYISGISKNVWFKIKKVTGEEVYACSHLAMEYGYIHWEIGAEVNSEFIASYKIANNNSQTSTGSVTSRGTVLLEDISIDDMVMNASFTDTSVIQNGDTITVLGVRR